MTEQPDYKNTVFLPQTDFPMRGDLPKKEPLLLEKWAGDDLSKKLSEKNKGGEKFVLHDGPPYANGNLHIGHALNKILKDVINRAMRMSGKHVAYIPGWDCHGLPIEWKIEEEYRAKKQNKDDVPVLEFRQQCRDYAAKWVEIQKAEFQRLGIDGLWNAPYVTMDFKAEAQIVKELHKLARNGSLYKGFKPVLWSVVEQTALAEAEVEYMEKESTEVYVGFKRNGGLLVKENFNREAIELSSALDGAYFVVWTTTPWTLPANAAIAYNPALKYVLIETTEGRKFVVAENLYEKFLEKVGLTLKNIVKTFQFPDLAMAHFHYKPYWTPAFAGDSTTDTECESPAKAGVQSLGLYPADFVTDTDGTGFVHIAPAHGEDDFQVYKDNQRFFDNGFPQIVNKDGTYKSTVPHFAGMHIFKETVTQKDGTVVKGTTDAILEKLREQGALLYSSKFKHSYPHSWRSKKPLIYLATPQWFVGMEKPAPAQVCHPREGGDSLLQQSQNVDSRLHGNDTPSIRAAALNAIDATTFHPAAGRNRIKSMVENRPDWCVSRQRAWGVPIALLVHKESGAVITDKPVLEKIAAEFAEKGCDVWYAESPAYFLDGTDYNPADYEKVMDILDVWFDSGCTHAFVLRHPVRPEWEAHVQHPADLYLEGSDQHRGWFQSSLLESVATRGVAPYKAILTHGFVLDEQGRKMSKSMGNVTAPEEVLKKYGADILRLWASCSDYFEDLRIGNTILEHYADMYRRLRNTLRYLLGALQGFGEAERVTDAGQLPEQEQYILHRLAQLNALREQCFKNYDFKGFYQELHNFCAVDLSAFYFDSRKDSLYCDAVDSPKRRATRTVFAILFDSLSKWLAPVLCFTTEEAWAAAGNTDSIHCQDFPHNPMVRLQASLDEKWGKIKDLRFVVNTALEQARIEKRIGSSLQASLTIIARDEYVDALIGIDAKELADLCIVSSLKMDSLVQEELGIPSRSGVYTAHVGYKNKTRHDRIGVNVDVDLATGDKCARCWKVTEEVGQQENHPSLCKRCAGVVG